MASNVLSSRLLVLLVAAVLVALAGWLVPLEPEVDSDFFFASGDPALRAEKRIARRFGSLSQVVILASSPDVADPTHLDGVERLTRSVASVDGVLAVHSLARGPDGLEDARDSPLWRRLVLAGDGSTSFVIAEIVESRAPHVVRELEEIVAKRTRAGFDLSLAGVPYTVEVMRRQLVRDFAVFSGAAVIVFGAVILLVFRSVWILVGTMASCVAAVAGTLLCLQAFGFGIGLLTANLTTIVFVLTQSHVVFLTTNWQAVASEVTDPRERVAAARSRTLRASIGSAATTLLGFGSLLFVPARPLQELGAGGALGATVALAAAYLAMPAFLEHARPRSRQQRRSSLAEPGPLKAASAATVCLALAIGLPLLQTDPSLLAYFDERGEVHEALSTLDRSGGSSPLSLVVQREDRARLDSEESTDRLWKLQHALEQDPAVGRVVSLPLLIGEARRIPGSFFLKDDWILDLIGPETTGAFLTADRRQTLYLLQMSESDRDARRSEIIGRVQAIAQELDFDTPLTGGIYKLQARLSDLVTRSMVWSLGVLVVLFAGVAALSAGSLRVGAAAGVTIGLVPLATLGAFGILGVPLDVIAAPAASVGFGLAADAALHLVSAWRRNDDPSAHRWAAACGEQWPGIARSAGIVALGFGLFALSSFPPTRRFGVGVAAATAIGALLAIQVLPGAARAMGANGSPDPDGGSREPARGAGGG